MATLKKPPSCQERESKSSQDHQLRQGAERACCTSQQEDAPQGKSARKPKRRTARIVTSLLLAASLLAVFALTEQSAVDTTALSRGVVYIVLDLVNGGIAPSSAEVGAWLKLARRLAHVAEFFLVGVCVSLACRAWLPQGDRRQRVRWTLLLCVAASLFDQTHKLFVAGREFDPLDLLFDAAGYGTAMLAVAGVSSLIRRRRTLTRDER